MQTLRASLLVSVVCAGVVLPTGGRAATGGDDTTSPHTVTANVALVSDYRFRGISQTYNLPAVQGGFDYAHSSGFYLGTWASSVSNNLFLNGSGMEWDFYGGYKWQLNDAVTLDFGVLQYWYPGAHFNDDHNTRYNNTEIYIGGVWDWFGFKYSYAATDYFGVNSDTFGGYAPIVNNRGRIDEGRTLGDSPGSSKGSGYLELNGTFTVWDNTILGLHFGWLDVKNYSALSYFDYKISLGYDFGWGVLSAAAITTTAQDKWYRYCETDGGDCKNPASSTLVLSLSRTL